MKLFYILFPVYSLIYSPAYFPVFNFKSDFSYDKIV